MTCKHYGKRLGKEDRHFIKAKEYNNCVLCKVNIEGSMTQEEVAKVLGVTKMRVSQIERQALKKIWKKRHSFYD